jgi:cobalt-zinc-cadmium efflux system outer membrane protein
MLDSLARGVAACAILTMSSISAPPAPAQPGASTEGFAISFAEALNLTLADNPVLKAQGLEVDLAEARLLQSTFRPNLELNFRLEDALGTDAFRGLHGAETTVTLGWMLERGVRDRIVDVARAGVNATAVEIEIAQLDAAAETARRFIETLVFQERYRNAEMGVELAREAVEAVRRRVAASRALEAELNRAEAEFARAELRLDDYEHELLSAYYLLSAQWGDTEPDFSAAQGDLSGMPRVDPFESLLTRVEQNPDLVAFMSQSRVAEAELNLARARARPSWQLTGGVRRAEFSDDWSLVGGVIVPLRLGNRNQGRIAETRANLDQIELAADAARNFIATELFVLYQELTHNFELAARLETDVAPKYESALADTRRAFELGRSSYLEYRAVQTELLEVAYEVLDAHADAWRLAIEIERLVGESLAIAPGNE